MGKTNRNGRTALHCASSSDHADTVRVLVDAGADVGKTCKDGRTALHLASEKGYAATVRVLLNAGADIHKTERIGWTALHSASSSGHVDTVRVLLDAGADIHKTDQSGRTALHVASASGKSDAETVRVLVDAGADIEKAEWEGWTALHQATWSDKPDTVRVLLDAGADIEKTIKGGDTALHLASNRGSAETIRVLLDAGADIEKMYGIGWTALHSASHKGKADAVRMLLENGAEIETTDTYERTPLAIAVIRPDSAVSASDRYHVARALCGHGAQWDAPAPELYENKYLRADAVDQERKLGAGLYACVLHWIQQRAADHSADLTHIPEETYTQGGEAVESYLASLAATDASQIVRRRKICVVGPSCSGKTSFVKSLSETMPILEKEEDRTIGIDLFALVFDQGSTATTSSINSKGKYEASIWDFAGQDIYQVAHTLYFSKRTLYLVFVNLEVYAKQLDEVSMDNVSNGEASVNRWVQDNVFRWVRLVLARQPDAELVIVCSKADAVTDDQAEEVLIDLNSRLGKWVKQFVNEMEGPAKDAAEKSVSEFQGRSQLRVSVVQQETVEAALQNLQHVVAEQRERAFVMPLMYTKVFEAIRKMRAEVNPTMNPAERVKRVIVPSRELVTQLTDEIDGLKEHECRTILATLHYLGDVLWFEQEYRLATVGLDTIILDPRIMLDIVREVVDHTLEMAVGDDYDALRDRGELKHSLLQMFDLWGVLCQQSQHRVLYFKQLLQRFNLAYPMGNQEMAWDSDLIVPAYWKSKRQLPESDEDVVAVQESFAFQVTWQYTFPAEVSETLFDQFIVRSYTVDHERLVSATQVQVTQADCWRACVRFHSGRKPSEDLVTIYVAAQTSEEGWSSLKSLVMAMEEVLHGYPGLGMVHRHLLLKSAAGKQSTFDLRRAMDKGAGRVTLTAFGTIQKRFSIPSAA